MTTTAALQDRRVLVVIAPSEFRDEELLEPKAALEREGAIVEIASTTTNPARGMLGAEVRPDLALDGVDPHRYAAIAVAGGTGARTYLWDERRLHAILRIARDDGTPLGAICLAPVALARAGVLRGVRATVYGDPRAKHELERGGALYAAEPVVTDQGIVTAAGPRDAHAFGAALVRLMRQHERAGAAPSRAHTT